MTVPREDLHLQDFGVGILAALRISGVTMLSDRDEVRLHGAFVSAFQHVEEVFDQEHLRFWMTTHPIHGTSTDAYNIMHYWLGIWATKDSPGHMWRFRMSEEIADRLVNEQLPGGRDMWLAAGQILIKEAGIIVQPRSLR